MIPEISMDVDRLKKKKNKTRLNYNLIRLKLF